MSKTDKELEAIEAQGKTCKDCKFYPCCEDDTILILCGGYKPKPRELA